MAEDRIPLGVTPDDEFRVKVVKNTPIETQLEIYIGDGYAGWVRRRREVNQETGVAEWAPTTWSWNSAETVYGKRTPDTARKMASMLEWLAALVEQLNANRAAPWLVEDPGTHP
jgi:hypothetical protein